MRFGAAFGSSCSRCSNYKTGVTNAVEDTEKNTGHWRAYVEQTDVKGPLKRAS